MPSHILNSLTVHINSGIINTSIMPLYLLHQACTTICRRQLISIIGLVQNSLASLTRLFFQIHVRICQIQTKNHVDIPTRALLSLELRLGNAPERGLLRAAASPPGSAATHCTDGCIMAPLSTHRLETLSVVTTWGNYERRGQSLT